jgi:hypothetical protein
VASPVTRIEGRAALSDGSCARAAPPGSIKRRRAKEPWIILFFIVASADCEQLACNLQTNGFLSSLI